MTKSKTYEEALENLDALKAELAEAKTDLREFKKENKIKRNKPVEDEKIASQLEKKDKGVEALRDKVEEAKTEAKELKPRKERVTKYTYPDDCVTDKDKKKYRAKMRREAKKAANPEKAPAEKKEKKVKKKPAAADED